MKSLVLIVALFCLSCERHQTAPADVEPVDAVSPSTSDVVVPPVDATVSDAVVPTSDVSDVRSSDAAEPVADASVSVDAAHSVDASVTDVVARDGG